MAGVIAGGLAQEAANTAFLAKADEIFNRPTEGLFSTFTDVVPCDGQSLEVDAMGPSPAVAELVGSRVYSGLRAYARRVPAKMYSTKALRLSRLQVENDKSGILAKRLQDYLSGAANFWDKPVTDELLANNTCIDGVDLISASHPHGVDGATWSNFANGALSPDSFNVGIYTMSGLRLENGEPAGIFPTHLMVGPKLRKIAFDLCENQLRPFPMAATGLEAYASALAPAAIGNWMAGKIQVIINPRMVGDYDDGWFLMDLSKPGIRPMLLGEAIAPSGVVVDAPGSSPRLDSASNDYYCEGAAAITAYIPHVIYGDVDG
jgi:phage major head subunit gpT-like protein